MGILQIQMSWFSVKEEKQTGQSLKLSKWVYLHTRIKKRSQKRYIQNGIG
uniref:Uncharacterized protein n=1 Tax=Arundo donax TaxID=35708 RepID=A0A0A9H6X1_ARUDO